MPSNVRDNILKMKNVSELMIDLAYSALFLQDKRIASEVEKLYDVIRNLENDTTKLMFKARYASDQERLTLLDLVDYIKDLSHSARDLAMLSKQDTPSLITDVLSEADERVITATVSKNSSLAGKTLGESNLRTLTKANVIAVNRKDEWLFELGREFKVEKDDFLVAAGAKEATQPFKDYCKGKKKL